MNDFNNVLADLSQPYVLISMRSSAYERNPSRETSWRNFECMFSQSLAKDQDISNIWSNVNTITKLTVQVVAA